MIDYKSDPVSSVEYSSKMEEYAVSIAVYCEASQQVVSTSVTGWQYFIETGVFCQVELEKN